jgi:ferrochelatase
MAYGTPASLDQMEAYLLDVRGGRPTPPALVDEIKQRYAQIGGHSPLLDLTKRQAAALEAELNRRNSSQLPQFRAFVGMRHWEPRIAQAVEEIFANGYKHLVAIVMSPYNSRMSSGMYFTRLEEAIAQQNTTIQVVRIDNWHDHPGLIAAFTSQAGRALKKFSNPDPFILFSAHSLPERILQQGDPYDSQLRETARLVAGQLDWPAGRWEFCYQSAGQSTEPWLGPPIEQVIERLAESGEKDLLVIPIGFLCDHVEVLYDIDIMARQIAAGHGVHLDRSDSLNDSPLFIAALADLVQEQMDPAAHLSK